MQSHRPHKDFQAQQTVYDGRHTGQVGDVYPSSLGESTAVSVFLQVHCSPHAQHEGRDARNAHHIDATDQGGENALIARGGAKRRMSGSSS